MPVDSWEEIAESFDRTRRKPWKKCVNFINSLPKESMVLDLACGNGRHLIPCTERFMRVMGGDKSKNFLDIVRRKIEDMKIRNVELARMDAKNLPIKDESFDGILFIAALHNIHDRENRISALKELKRILNKNGRALITVWSRWQDRWRRHFFWKAINPIYLFKKEFGDIMVPWGKKKIPRFYHLYGEKELKKDARKSGLKIESLKSVKIVSKKHADNYFMVVVK